MVKGEKWFKYFEEKVTNKKTPVCQGDNLRENIKDSFCQLISHKLKRLLLHLGLIKYI